MAFHSLGGLRSLATIHAPDRVVMRLSPIQTWILERALDHLNGWLPIPPAKAVTEAARRLEARGLLYLQRGATAVRYRFLRDAENVGEVRALPRVGVRSGFRSIE